MQTRIYVNIVKITLQDSSSIVDESFVHCYGGCEFEPRRR